MAIFSVSCTTVRRPLGGPLALGGGGVPRGEASVARGAGRGAASLAARTATPGARQARVAATRILAAWRGTLRAPRRCSLAVDAVRPVPTTA